MATKNPAQVGEIVAICTRLGIGERELARRAGIQPETMRKIARGYQAASERLMQSLRNVEATAELVARAAALAAAPAATTSPAEPAPPAAPRLREALPANWVEPRPALVPARVVPVVSWGAAGAAHDYADLANQLDQSVESTCRDPNAFALIVEGDSMEKEIFAGDIVIFSPNHEPRNGDIVVARLAEDHGVLLKRFRRIGPEGRTIRLESTNPEYETREFPAQAFRFIYPAVELKRQLRR